MRAAHERLAGILERAKSWRVMAPRLHDWLIRRQIDMFRSSGATEGQRWSTYQGEPKYKAYKRALVRKGVIRDMSPLRFRGASKERLYPSLRYRSHPEHVWRPGNHKMVFGTRVPYAKRLEEGGTNQFGERFAPRKFATLGGRSRERLGQLVALYIARGTTRGNVWDR